jgi:hypothetical protein
MRKRPGADLPRALRRYTRAQAAPVTVVSFFR